MRPRGYLGGMRDSEVVAAIVAGDPEGLAAAYDRYAAPLYNYCRTLLREPADAADAVQDTFVISASKLSALRDPERLRSWLYAVARNECHRRLRGGSAYAPLEEAPDVTDESADVSADAERRELRTLVSAALGGVGPAEREVLELQLRQGLDGGEVAAVLGVTRNHAHALLSRARDQLETSLGVLLVARSGRERCPELDAMLTDWDGELTVLLRKRLNRHIERCPICSDRRRRELAPAMFLGLAPILALPAITAALPEGLRETVLHAAGAASPAGSAAAGAGAAGAGAAHPATAALALGRGGFPKPLDRPPHAWWRSRHVQVGTAAACAAGIAVAGVIIASPTQQHDHGTLPAAAVPSASSSTSPGSTPSPRRHGSRSGTAPASASAAASITRGADASGRAQPTTGTPSGGASTPTAPASSTASPTSPASSTSPTAPTSSAPAAGTLTVSPTSIVLSPLLGGSFTLTASGGPVTWSVTEPSSLLGALSVSQSSGTLASGQSETVTLTVSDLASLDTTLTVDPGNTSITVLLGLG
jgi:RNA polymerase sigma factor (sigma-70 family)